MITKGQVVTITAHDWEADAEGIVIEELKENEEGFNFLVKTGGNGQTYKFKTDELLEIKSDKWPC